MFSSDYYVLRSTVIRLNNLIQYSHCQVTCLVGEEFCGCQLAKWLLPAIQAHQDLL